LRGEGSTDDAHTEELAMRLANFLQYGGDPRAAADQVVAQERAGLDIVWVAEAYGFDSPTLMGYLAARTETVQIGAGILNVYSRTPAAIAQTAAGLDNVSKGRAMLGLGASGPQVIEGFHGVAYDKPLTRTREVIDVVRQVLARDAPLELDGRSVTIPLPADQGRGLGKPLKLLNHPERSAVPIYVAALGEKNVTMTAEVADGWLPHLFVPEHADAVWGEALTAGRAARDSSLPDLEVVAGGMLAIAEGDERDRLLDSGRSMIALYVGGMGSKGTNFYNDLFVRYGYEQEAAQIQDLYLAGKKTEAEAKVPREALERSNLVGSPGFIQERIAAFAEAGVTILNTIPLDPDPDLIAQVRGWLPS
jgi:F420-dependent oxidoreductase-like protein